MNKKSVSICITPFQVEYGDKRALEIAKNMGADAVDFGTFSFSQRERWDYRNPASIYSQGEGAIVKYYTEIREYAQSLGLMIGQTHGRGEGFVNRKADDDAQVENARLDLLVASVLGAEACVVHSPTTIILGKNFAPQKMRDLAYEQYMRMLPYADEYQVKLAIETFGDATGLDCIDFFGDIDEFLSLYHRVKADSPFGERFTVCVDTGHSNKSTRFGNPKVGDVIRRIGNDISVLHLNDNDTLTDQHKTPMTGSIDWKDTLDALDEVGYCGIYNMELDLKQFGKDFMEEYATFSIKVMKQILKNR